MSQDTSEQPSPFEPTEGTEVDALEQEADSLGLLLPPEATNWSNISEIEARNWRDYPDIVTDSLWIIGARSREGGHSGQYHGNFVPQIPHQALRRFTKPGDVILDTFLGSGTSLIEAQRLGRHGIGIELNPAIAEETAAYIAAMENPHQTWQQIIQGDSTAAETIAQVRQQLQAQGREQVQLIMMHPPYHDIIKFSDNAQDLSNAHSVADFLTSFQKIVHLTYDLLEQKHFLVVVIGDKYSDKTWIPLGFRTMEAVQTAGYTLKSIVVKNMEGNRAKRNVQNLWRQRAFKGDWYIFKHEYVFFFQKTDQVFGPLERLTELVQQLDTREKRNLISSINSTFGTGEALQPRLLDAQPLPSILPPRILTLKHGGRIRGVVINLLDLPLTDSLTSDLRALLAALPDTVIDVSALAESNKQADLQALGIAQVYQVDEADLEKLAHALYIIKKVSSGKKRGA